MTNNNYLYMYLIFINVFSYMLFFFDKRRARKDKWRIKESTLHLSSFLGGTTGSIVAMILFHHKTKKPKFCFITALALIFNIYILCLLLK